MSSDQRGLQKIYIYIYKTCPIETKYVDKKIESNILRIQYNERFTSDL